MPLVQVDQRSPEWFAARKGKVTASLAAACLGIDPHRGPLSAWNEITGRKSQGQNAAMTWGLRSEAEAMAAYEVLTGMLARPTGFWTHPDMPWLGASPDGLVGEDGLVEVKCPVKPVAEPTPSQVVQVRVQLACTGRLSGDWFAWQADANKLVLIERDADVEREILHRLTQFYETYVLPDRPPPRRRPTEEA